MSPFSYLLNYWKFVCEVDIILWHLIFWVRLAYGPRSDRLSDSWYWTELGLDALICADVILKFFTGVPSSQANKYPNLRDKIDQQTADTGYVQELKIIAYIYLRTTLIVDLVSLIPFFLNWFVHKGGGEWQALYYLKVVRLLFSRSINVSVSRILKRVSSKNVDYLKFTA